MRVTAVTVGIPVRDLEGAVRWYRAALELAEPDLMPVPGIVEFDLGASWLQLVHSPSIAGVEGKSLTISVADVHLEQARMSALGPQVGDVQRFEGAVDLFELTDPDGNVLGFVTELA